jgi:hypothetical protein
MGKQEWRQEVECLTTLYRLDIEDILSKPHDLRATLVKALTDFVYVGLGPGGSLEQNEAYTNAWASTAEPHWIDTLLDIMLTPPPFRQSIGQDWWDDMVVLFTAQVAQMYHKRPSAHVCLTSTTHVASEYSLHHCVNTSDGGDSILASEYRSGRFHGRRGT